MVYLKIMTDKENENKDVPLKIGFFILDTWQKTVTTIIAFIIIMIPVIAVVARAIRAMLSMD